MRLGVEEVEFLSGRWESFDAFPAGKFPESLFVWQVFGVAGEETRECCFRRLAVKKPIWSDHWTEGKYALETGNGSKYRRKCAKNGHNPESGRNPNRGLAKPDINIKSSSKTTFARSSPWQLNYGIVSHTVGVGGGLPPRILKIIFLPPCLYWEYKAYCELFLRGTEILSLVCANSGMTESGIRVIDCMVF